LTFQSSIVARSKKKSIQMADFLQQTMRSCTSKKPKFLNYQLFFSVDNKKLMTHVCQPGNAFLFSLFNNLFSCIRGKSWHKCCLYKRPL